MRIGVVGLGLIGGSIFKALSCQYEVVGVSSSVKLNNVSDNFDVLRTCDIVFVCTPMNVTLSVLDRLEGILSENAIVTDVCSLKSFVTKKHYSYKFIPSHPMAGTENSGWESSFKELFEGAKWVITPFEVHCSEEQKCLEDVIKSMGAEIIVTTPEEHDQAVALISHLPMVIAQALCENIKNNQLAQVLASSGFRDTTRLALSNLEMANDMIELNQENIIQALDSLKDCLQGLLDENYLNKATEIKEFRRNLY